MTIAPTLQRYLADHEVAYDLVPHPPTESSLGTAEACHIPTDRLAVEGGAKSGHPAAMDQGSQTLILG